MKNLILVLTPLFIRGFAFNKRDNTVLFKIEKKVSGIKSEETFK
jgi:hypothetical protein